MPFPTRTRQAPPVVWSPEPNQIAADTNDTVHSEAVMLDDGFIPGYQAVGPVGFTGDLFPVSEVPQYAGGDESREIIFTPGPVAGYSNLSGDTVNRRDVGSIPGTNFVNIHNGPVGRDTSGYLEGNRTPTFSQPAAYYGPVGRTGSDYATSVAYSNFYSHFNTVSTDAANAAAVAAI